MNFSKLSGRQFSLRLARALRPWKLRAVGHATMQEHRAPSHAERPSCPGAYALLAGVARR